MKKRPAIVLLNLLLPLAACNPPPKPSPEPVPRPRATAYAAQPSVTQNFDYYLLNLSWSPEFCHSHPNATECAQHSAFVLHGLWPQNDNGTYPQNCSPEPGPRDPAAFSDIYPDPGLLVHEWRTHGTCSGLSPDAFFTLARSAFHSVAIPPTLSTLDHQISMPPSQILDLLPHPIHPFPVVWLSHDNRISPPSESALDKSAQPPPVRLHQLPPRQHGPHHPSCVRYAYRRHKPAHRVRGKLRRTACDIHQGQIAIRRTSDGICVVSPRLICGRHERHEAATPPRTLLHLRIARRTRASANRTGRYPVLLVPVHLDPRQTITAMNRSRPSRSQAAAAVVHAVCDTVRNITRRKVETQRSMEAVAQLQAHESCNRSELVTRCGRSVVATSHLRRQCPPAHAALREHCPRPPCSTAATPGSPHRRYQYSCPAGGAVDGRASPSETRDLRNDPARW